MGPGYNYQGWEYDPATDRLVPAGTASAPRADLSGPAYNYTAPDAPPPGLGGVEDQRSINWQMAQKYGAERATQNRDIQKLYDQAYNNWLLNGQKGPPPNQPALFETNPNSLYGYFNSSQPGVLLQGGRVVDNRQSMGRVDPLTFMSQQGTPGPRPAPPPAAAAPAAASTPGAVPDYINQPPPPGVLAQRPAPTTASTTASPVDFGSNLTPEQRARGAATGPQPEGTPSTPYNYPTPPGTLSQAPAGSKVPAQTASPSQEVTGFVANPGLSWNNVYGGPSSSPQTMQLPQNTPQYRFSQAAQKIGLPAARSNQDPMTRGGQVTGYQLPGRNRRGY